MALQPILFEEPILLNLTVCCPARPEQDIQASDSQSVSIEDTFSQGHGSVGKRAPASKYLLSELAIVAGVAKAAVPHRSASDAPGKWACVSSTAGDPVLIAACAHPAWAGS